MNWVFALTLVACVLALTHWEAADAKWAYPTFWPWRQLVASSLTILYLLQKRLFTDLFEIMVSHAESSSRRHWPLDKLLLLTLLLHLAEKLQVFLAIFDVVTFDIGNWDLVTACVLVHGGIAIVVLARFGDLLRNHTVNYQWLIHLAWHVHLCWNLWLRLPHVLCFNGLLTLAHVGLFLLGLGLLDAFQFLLELGSLFI